MTWDTDITYIELQAIKWWQINHPAWFQLKIVISNLLIIFYSFSVFHYMTSICLDPLIKSYWSLKILKITLNSVLIAKRPVEVTGFDLKFEKPHLKFSWGLLEGKNCFMLIMFASCVNIFFVKVYVTHLQSMVMQLGFYLKIQGGTKLVWWFFGSRGDLVRYIQKNFYFHLSKSLQEM